MTFSKRLTVLMAHTLIAASMLGCASNRPRDPFAQGLDRGPTPGTLHMMSRLLIDQRQPEKAEFVLQRIIAEHPGYAPAYVELAELQARTFRPDEAIATLEASVANRGKDPVVLNNIGVLYLQQGNADAAVDAFGDAVDLDGGEARYWSNLGLALAMVGRDDEAFSAYRRALSLAETHWNIGVARAARGDGEAAHASFETAMELDPSFANDVAPMGPPTASVPTP